MSKKNRHSRGPQPPGLAHPPLLTSNQVQITRQVEHREEFSGPLPPPDALKRYDELMPGMADRIVRMAETQMVHRHTVEIRVVDVNVELAKTDRLDIRRGQWFGFLLGLAAIGAAVYTGVNGAQWAASVIAGGGLASLVGALVVGRRDTSKQNATSSDAQQSAQQQPDAKR